MTPVAQLVARLTERSHTLALAESCTGGLLAARVTSVPGASAVFRGGVIADHNEVKCDLLGVSAATLAAYGAVSAETALAMAQGARRRLQATLAASITGVAGPDGGTAEKPVGIVFIAVAGPRGVRVEHCQFAGDRDAICAQACDAALQMLLEAREGQNDRW